MLATSQLTIVVLLQFSGPDDLSSATFMPRSLSNESQTANPCWSCSERMQLRVGGVRGRT